MTKDAIVVGGGVIGCSIAWRLAQAGVKVTLVERVRIGQEASWAAAGMLGPHAEAGGRDAFFKLGLKSREIWPAFADELKESTGIDVEYRSEGGLFVSVTPTDPEFDEWLAWQNTAGLELRTVSVDELRRLEPQISPFAARAVFIPGEHQVENRLVMKALAKAIHSCGVHAIEGREVGGLVLEGGRVKGVLAGGDRIEAEHVVVAAGCWSSSLLKPLGLNAEVVPARGQMLAVRGPKLNHLVHSSNCYLVPRRDGRLLIGATVEYAGFEKALTVSGVSSLLEPARRLVPSIDDATIVESWSGLRPDTGDHLPIIGPTGVEGLTLAIGHFRNGILFTPITAALVSESILSGRSPAELRPFNVARFSA